MGNNTLNETPIQTTFDESEFAAENGGRKNDDKDLKNKTKKVFVAFINDDNIPDIIEMGKSKREKRKLIRKKDISSVMEKEINKREIDIPKSLNNKKVF